MVDSPYLIRHPILAPLIEWGGTILLAGLVLSPFSILFVVRARPLGWRHGIGAYLSSFVVLAILIFLILRYDQWLIWEFFNNHWLNNAYDNAIVQALLIVLAGWIATPFMIVKAVYKNFTIIRFMYALALSIIILVALIFLMIYVGSYAIGTIGRDHF